MRAFRVLLVALLGLVITLSAALPARAANDVIELLSVDYVVNADGSVHVTETVEWNFNRDDAKGIYWDIVVQEPWEEDKDKVRVYDVTDIDVASPSGADPQFKELHETDGHWEFITLEIGSDEPIGSRTATYEITYTVDGILNTFDGTPELFEDMNSDGLPPVKKAEATVTAPGGVIEARCLVEDEECTSSAGETATYSAEDLSESRLMSVAASFDPSAVAAAEPKLKDAPSGSGILGGDDPWWTHPIVTGLAGLILGTIPLGVRKLLRPTDQRWQGVPPGVMSPGAPVTKKKFEGQIPVRFEPPEVDLAQAGLALDGGFRPSHLAAVMVNMAVNGAVALKSDPLSMAQLDESKLSSRLEKRVFSHANPRTNKGSLSDKQVRTMAGAMDSHNAPGYAELLTKPKETVGTGYLRRFAPILFVGLAILFINIGVNPFALIFMAFGFFVATIAITLVMHFGPKEKALARTPAGTAIKEQAQGFRTYIETAEADQLNFEADQDIYRRYLPWAVLFDLTDRWVEVCEGLAKAGRIPALDNTFIADGGTPSNMRRAVRNIRRRSEGAHASNVQEAREKARREAMRRSSGGGSGGRSGFSSSSRGGGGSRGRSGRSR